jgi:hypothetical protein
VADCALRQVSFTVENRTSDQHSTALWLSPPEGSAFDLVQDGKPVPLTSTHNWDYPLRAVLKMTGKSARIELTESNPK